MEGDYDWYVDNDFSRYEGNWIAIKNKKVIAHDKKAEELFKKLGKKGKQNAFITKISKKRLRIR